MYRDQTDVLWLLPLFLAALFLLASAQLWWRVAHGKRIGGVELKPGPGDLKLAAFASCVSSLLLAVSIFAAFWVRG
jgi:hypothetical protein